MATTSTQNVFGAGLSVGLGYSFDPVEFIKRPTTILRILSWVFSIIVFGCISSGCYVDNLCIFRFDNGACGFGIFVGAVAFVACIAFLILDALFERLTSALHRKYALLADLTFSAVWAFFYFVAFCYLTNRLVNTSQLALLLLNVQQWQINNARASIAFAFFSICTFGILVYFAVQKYRQGLENAFPPASQIESQVAAGSGDPQAGLPKPGAGYQERPFSGAGNSSEVGSDRYQAPTY